MQGLASQGPCNLFGYNLIKEQENTERKETALAFSPDGTRMKGRKRKLLPWSPHTWLSWCYSPNSTEEVVISRNVSAQSPAKMNLAAAVTVTEHSPISKNYKIVLISHCASCSLIQSLVYVAKELSVTGEKLNLQFPKKFLVFRRC